METEMYEIEINGQTYVRVDPNPEFAREEAVIGLPAVIARTYSAGVFYGYLKERNGKEITLLNARRMWQFYGASLSQCAQSGTPDASKCKFPEAVDRIDLTEVIEILYLTAKAKKSLDGVEIWKME